MFRGLILSRKKFFRNKISMIKDFQSLGTFIAIRKLFNYLTKPVDIQKHRIMCSKLTNSLSNEPFFVTSMHLYKIRTAIQTKMMKLA